MEEIIEYYNKIKQKCDFNTDTKVKNYKNVEELKNCSTDEVIESVVRSFCAESMDLEYIKEHKSKKYLDTYQYKVLEIEKEILEDISLKEAKSFFEHIADLKEHGNYEILDLYFNGFYVGTKLVEEAFSEKYLVGDIKG